MYKVEKSINKPINQSISSDGVVDCTRAVCILEGAELQQLQMFR